MGQKMCWNEVVKSFPDEWVAFVDYHDNGKSEIEGVVVTHHKDRKLFHETVGRLPPQYNDISIRYTGTRIKDENIPFLRQITSTR